MNKNLFKDIGKIKTITDEEFLELFNQYKQGNQQAYNKIIESYLRLVVYYAGKYHNALNKIEIIDINDLISEGTIGLIDALGKYDETVGAKFSYFAGFSIKKTIADSIMNSANTIKIPQAKILINNKLRKLMNKLEQEIEGEIFDVHLYGKTQYNDRHIDEYFTKDQILNIFNMDENLDAVDEDSIESYLDDDLISYKIKQALRKLKPRHRYVVKYYFGIDGCDKMNTNEICENLDITKQRLGQIKKAAIDKLKELINLK